MWILNETEVFNTFCDNKAATVDFCVSGQNYNFPLFLLLKGVGPIVLVWKVRSIDDLFEKVYSICISKSDTVIIVDFQIIIFSFFSWKKKSKFNR